MLKRSLALAATLTVLLTACDVTGSKNTQAEPESSASSGSSAASGSGTSCAFTSDGSQPSKQATPPADSTDLTGTVTATMKTSAGDLVLDLNADAAPCTVASFVSLAEQSYFNDTECHRLTTDGLWVLQCGDPTASGTGGPGYTIPDELSGSESYGAGTIAMANTGAVNTGGSQFFLVYEDTELPPTYTVFGQLDAASLKLVQKVAAKGTSNGLADGPPKQPVKISSVAIN